MSSTMTTTRSPSISLNKTDKANKPSRVIILRLSPKLLARFEEKPQQQPEQQAEQQHEESSHTSEAPSPTPVIPNAPLLKVDSASESNSTPAPPTDAPTNGDPPKKRKGPAPGTKRTIALTADGIPKPRGKPGPKKKPRLEDGTIDHTNKPTVTGGANPKLGPKMNAGTINANLRALDRSGKPCRKWTPKPFFVKSFTGVSWEAPSWKGNNKASYLNGDDSSETKDISMQSSSELRPNESDTAMDSNAGEVQDPMALSTPAASSPPPIPAQPAIAAQG